MQLILIGVVLIISIAVIFTVQNAGIVTVIFLAWKFDLSLALLLLSAFVCGVVVTFLASIPSRLRKNRVVAEQRRIIKDLGESVVRDQELTKPTKFVQ